MSFNGTKPYRRPKLAARNVERASVAVVHVDDKAAWLRSADAKLNADERLVLHRAVAKMNADQFSRVQALSLDDAMAAFRAEHGLPPDAVTVLRREVADLRREVAKLRRETDRRTANTQGAVR